MGMSDMNGDNFLSSSQQQQRMQLWSRGCRLIGVVVLLAVVGMSAALYRSYRQPGLETTPQRINPNTASMASLVRLPGIGKARAMDIMHYRESHGRGEAVFESADDLQAIRGIGPKTVQNLKPYMTFETEQKTE